MKKIQPFLYFQLASNCRYSLCIWNTIYLSDMLFSNISSSDKSFIKLLAKPNKPKLSPIYLILVL